MLINGKIKVMANAEVYGTIAFYLGHRDVIDAYLSS
jgi:hypothetical protein